jgi:hypothetical protein
MILSQINEIIIKDVCDRGVPNQERIVLFVNENINLGEYGMLLGVRTGRGYVYPLKDNFYWFGDGNVSRGDWIFVYTGIGEPKTYQIPSSQNRSYSIHWGRSVTILNNNELVPFLVKLNGIQIFSEGPILLENN